MMSRLRPILRRAHGAALVLLGVVALSVSLASGGAMFGLIGLVLLVAGAVDLLLGAMPEHLHDSSEHPMKLRHPFLH